MRTARPTLMTTLVAGLALSSNVACAQQHNAGAPAANKTPAPLPAALHASDQSASLPVKSITLYRSGVASFERRGSVDNDASATLRFRTEQINDILKSLVVLDLSGGTIAGVSYPSQDPLSRRLSGFGIDISDNPSASEVLNRLRGTPVRINTAESSVEGTVLNVENRPTVYPPKGDGTTVRHDLPWINLLTKTGIRSVNLTDATGFEILDAKLAEDLTQALGAIADQRSDQYKTVELDLRGDGTRNIAVAYVHEAPVWKTSYRLVLDADRASKDKPLLQGWAIVENTTDEDWRNVQLSLASGQPSAFRMNLYEPLYQERPEVAVPVPLAVAPRSYEEQLALFTGSPSMDADVEGRAKSIAGAGGGQSPFRSPGAPAAVAARSAGYSEDKRKESEQAIMNRSAVLASAPSAAAGVETGDVFFYRVAQPVTIDRQRSAMLPIVSQEVKARRVSIRTPGDTGTHPRLGLEVTNDSGLELIAGPVSVYEGEVYAGDAQIGDTGKGDVRLLSYSMDSDVTITTDASFTSHTTSIRIVKGLFELKNVSTSTAEYRIASNDEDAPRTLILEHPKVPNAKLTEPKAPTSQTPTQYRFEIELKPKETKTLKVIQALTGASMLGVLDMSEDALRTYATDGASISNAVREAYSKAHQLRAAVTDAQRRVGEIETEQGEIRTEQARIRENLNTLDRSGDLAVRLVKKLSDQETRMENLFEMLKTAREGVKTAQAKLDEYVSNLSVE